MTTLNFKAGLLCFAGLMLGGCMTPPVSWRHDPGMARYRQSDYSLVIEPVEDLRNLRNENPSWMTYMPFVLWTWERDEAFDLILAKEGTKRLSEPNPAMGFVATRDLHDAIHQQLGSEGLFKPVFASAEESGPWAGGKEKEWILHLTLKQLTLEQRHLPYGLGPVSFVAWGLGAPTRVVSLSVAFDLTLKDSKGAAKYEGSMKTSRNFVDGWYFRADGEQRALDFLSFVLGEELDRMQSALSAASTKPSP